MNRATCYRHSFTRCWANLWISSHIISQFLMEEIIFLHNSKLSPAGLQSPPTTLLWVYPQEGAGSKYQNGRWTNFLKATVTWGVFFVFNIYLEVSLQRFGYFQFMFNSKIAQQEFFLILHTIYKVFSYVLDYNQKLNWILVTLNGKDSSSLPIVYTWGVARQKPFPMSFSTIQKVILLQIFLIWLIIKKLAHLPPPPPFSTYSVMG